MRCDYEVCLLLTRAGELRDNCCCDSLQVNEHRATELRAARRVNGYHDCYSTGRDEPLKSQKIAEFFGKSCSVVARCHHCALWFVYGRDGMDSDVRGEKNFCRGGNIKLRQDRQ